MEENGRTMLRYLREASETLERIKRLEERIASRTIRVTPSYRTVGGGRSSSPSVSEVERYVEEKIELEEELVKCRVRLTLIEYVKESGVLSGIEYELIEWLQIGGRLSDFARSHGIYKSHVYKIRDKAIEKMLEFVQSSPKCTELWVKS